MNENVRTRGDATEKSVGLPLNVWHKRAKRTFNRLHRLSVKTVLEGNDDITLDGNTSSMGKVIEAWAIRAVGENSDEIDARIGKLILNDYFSGRYPKLAGACGETYERGYNLNGEAYYFTRVIRARPTVGCQNLISKVKVFRDYDRSPKTFSYNGDIGKN